MIGHPDLPDQELHRRIRQQEITLGGNNKLKIYGRLDCRSGKRMKKENRVFFGSPDEAVRQGYRPCGHCMTSDYKKWKNGLIL
jgi:methylphosphotriester-DNA--protein-cysteine methyltransferase